MAEQKVNGFKDGPISPVETVDGDHGRIATRKTPVIHDADGRQKRSDGPGLNSVVMVESTRDIGTEIETEPRRDSTSRALRATLLAPIVHHHRAIGNCLPRVMDLTFRADECRGRID